MHEVYQNILLKKLTSWQRRKARALKEEWLEAALVLLRLNLDAASEQLQQLYSSEPRGRPPYDAICMLRALLLMSLLRMVSITEFAQELSRQPRLAIIAGFEEGAKTPSVGAFYAFIDRLEEAAE